MSGSASALEGFWPRDGSMVRLPFAKMNGIGNSILVVDLRATGVTLDGSAARRIGQDPALTFDQLMAINPPRSAGTDAFIDIFNIDGSRAGACGNGTRCVAWVMNKGAPKRDLLLQTVAGLLPVSQVDDATFAVDMGPPKLAWHDIPLRDPAGDTASVMLPDGIPGVPRSFSAVSMGNPHAVFFVADATRIDLAAVGPLVEMDPMFPDRVNVSFATVVDRGHIVLRTWERSAGATLACGSAACATAVAAVRSGLADRDVTVSQRGGDLHIAWRSADDRVIMTGGVVLEAEGLLPALTLGAAA